MLSIIDLKKYLSFAIAAYDDEHFELPAGYNLVTRQVMTHSGLSGYSAFNNHTQELVFSFSGTSFGNLNSKHELDFYRDLINNFGYMFADNMSQFNCARIIAETSLSILENHGVDINNLSITFTGHSLGAIVAEHMLIEFASTHANALTIVFDSPGALEILSKKFGIDSIAKVQEKIINIVASPNFINSFGKQIGSTFSMLQGQTIGEISAFDVIYDFFTHRKQVMTHKLDYFKSLVESYSGELTRIENWNNFSYTGSIEKAFKSFKSTVDNFFPDSLNPFTYLENHDALDTTSVAMNLRTFVQGITEHLDALGLINNFSNEVD